jgi:hypothetical protein
VRWTFALTLAVATNVGCSGGPASADAGADAGSTTDAGRDAGLDAGVDGGDGGPASDGGGDGGFLEASHDVFPQIPFGGGPVLAHPSLVTITFPGLALAQQAQSFDSWIASSPWLATVGQDYGVGNGPPTANVELDAGPPPWVGSADVAAFLAQSFDAGLLPPPVADGGQIYVLYLPANAPLSGICLSVFGYHDNALYGGVEFAYAVVPDCPESATGFPDLENLQLVASHEIVEAATNPYANGPGGRLGWELTDPTNPWWAPGFGEVADVCEGQIWQAPDAGWFAQRIWSNSQAALGTGSPCVPLPADPYFNVSPQPDTILTIDAGSSVTIQITGWSNAAGPPWDLTEMAYFGDFDPAPLFADAGIGNGVTQALTLSVPPGTPSGARTQVWLGSYPPASDNYTSYWPVAVVVQ